MPVPGPPASLVACLGCPEAEVRARREAVPGLVWRSPPPLAKSAWTYPDLSWSAYKSGSWPQLAVIVMTSPRRTQQRNAIRRTWGDESNYPNRTFRTIFFMNAEAGTQEAIKGESKLFDDVVVQATLFGGVRRPMVTSLSSLIAEWVPCYIWGSQLVLVLRRDDCLVNVHELISGFSLLLNVTARLMGPGNPVAIVFGNGGSSATRSGVASSDKSNGGRGSFRSDHASDRSNVRVFGATSPKGGSSSTGGPTAESEPCAMLAVGNDAFIRLQPFFADDSDDERFFNGSLARAANLTLGHVDGLYPCSGADLTPRDYRRGWITRCGLSPGEMMVRYAKLFWR